MTDRNEPKPVREARAKARRLAKTTPDLSYQQALDHVARDAGADHWAAFMARHPVDAPSSLVPPESTATAPGRRTGLGDYVRSMVTGQRAADQERIRAAVILEEEEVDEILGVKDRRRGLWLSAAGRIMVLPLVILLIGCVSHAAGIPGYVFSWTDMFRAILVALGTAAGVFLLCLAIGDQPGMERRRATTWTLLCWTEALGYVAFFAGGIGAFDSAVEHATGISPTVTTFIGVTTFIFGSSIRRSLHALMVLGAALGPKSASGGSIADLAAIARTRPAAEQPVRRPHLTIEEIRELGRPKPWWKRIGLVDVILLAILVGAVLSFVALGMQFGLGIDARPLAWVAVAIFSPLFIGAMVLPMIEFLGEILHIPVLTGMDSRASRAERKAVRKD